MSNFFKQVKTKITTCSNMSENFNKTFKDLEKTISEAFKDAESTSSIEENNLKVEVKDGNVTVTGEVKKLVVNGKEVKLEKNN